jgi:hypothetical protein
MIYALDIAAWDFLLGVALLLSAAVFSSSRLAVWGRRGLIVSGLLCLGGLLGAVLGNVNVRKYRHPRVRLRAARCVAPDGSAFRGHTRNG